VVVGIVLALEKWRPNFKPQKKKI